MASPKAGYDHLDLSCSVLLGVEALLAKMEEFMSFIVASVEGCKCASVEFVCGIS